MSLQRSIIKISITTCLRKVAKKEMEENKVRGGEDEVDQSGVVVTPHSPICQYPIPYLLVIFLPHIFHCFYTNTEPIMPPVTNGQFSYNVDTLYVAASGGQIHRRAAPAEIKALYDTATTDKSTPDHPGH